MGGKKVKAVDKWKSKKWYTVKAPQLFDNKELCEIVAADPKRLPNRIIKSSLFELGTGGSSQIAMFTTLRFRIIDVSGVEAQTKLLGHEISPSFIKTFARRGKSLIHQVVDEKTKDGQNLRLKIIAVTGSRVSENTRRNLRSILVEETKKSIVEKPFDEVIQDVIYGRFSSKLFSRLKQITKMRRVEVRKSERGEIFK
jgi:small subunit ribosomal protein S3Ae